MKVNLKLLKNLYLINHPSRQEYPMINFILNYCYKIPKLTLEIDHYNNLFITKNTTNPDSFVCVIAHLDSFHDIKEPRYIVKDKNIIYARLSNNQQCGLNADDCNGILIALQLLETLPNLKVCFTTEEESGGIGAYQTAYNEEFFKDINYLLQADRRGYKDLIYYTNGTLITSNTFLMDLFPIYQKYNYELEKGIFTDVGIISEMYNISGVNISCGYYNEHTSREICNIKELENCLNFMYEIITTLPSKKYPINDI